MDRGELESGEPDGGRERVEEEEVDGEGGAGRFDVSEVKDGRVDSLDSESRPGLGVVGVIDIVY